MAKSKYAGTQTEKNLQEAFSGESQARNKYTYFASVAKKEGYEQMSALFLKTADNEKEHAKMWFKELAGIGDTKANLEAAADGENYEWTDMQTPKANDNTHRTYAAYLPLVAACRPDWDETTVKRKTFCLITIMQQTFLRYETISKMLDIDLSQRDNRRAFHTQILHDVLEV